MASIKISSKVDEDVWDQLKSHSQKSHQNISGLLTEAIREYLQRKNLRPEVLDHLRDSIEANRELGRKLAE